MDVTAYLKSVLDQAIAIKGQDLFLKPGTTPRVRASGSVSPLEVEPMDKSGLEELTRSLLAEYEWEALQRDKSVDFAFMLEGLDYRFRGNAFFNQGQISLVIRILWKGIPSFEELGLPSVLKDMALAKSGIILLAGVVSSGKSTTIAAMIDAINVNSNRHIITIEDPVEFLHDDKNSIVHQREIGHDAHDFNSALRYVVRQSPDVVVIGEMRDAETLRFALNAAEVGRLVISTVHAQSVPQIFDRVLGFFQPEHREGVLRHFSMNMTCLAVQKLLVGKDKKLVPAIEIMVGNYTTQQLALDHKYDKMHQAMMNAESEGMQTMDQCILKLFQDGVITRETALENCVKPREMENLLKGIQIKSTGKILGT